LRVVAPDGITLWHIDSGQVPSYSTTVSAVSDSLLQGAALPADRFLLSADGRYRAMVQSDGNVVVWGPGYQVLWTSNTVLPARQEWWECWDPFPVGYNYAEGYRDPTLEIRNGILELWVTHYIEDPCLQHGGSRAWREMRWFTSNQHFGSKLAVQSDGNLVLYNHVTGAAVWSTQTGGRGHTPSAVKTGWGLLRDGLFEKCMDVRNGSSVSGTPVQIWQCNATAAQLWTVQGQTIRALGKCLDVVGGSTAAGAKVQLWDCNGSGAQNWVYQTNSTLRNPQSGLCLDIPGGNRANGNQLGIWQCDGRNTSELWR
jgi:hypothetical protein